MLGIGLGLTHVAVVGRVGGGGYEFVITSDADWSAIPAGLLTSGGTIGVAPGNYTSKTLSHTPSAELRFVATNPADKPVIDKLVLSQAQNLTFESLRLACSTWANADATAAAVLATTGTSTNIIFDRCDIWGNYQGTIGADVDVTTDLPEVASILPQFNSGGAVTSLIIQNSNVYGLMADGTYSLTFTAGSGYSFSVAPVASMTVSGGVITGTTITSGGSSTYTDAYNGTTGGLSTIISWTGQRKMLDWLPDGIICSGGGGFNGLSVTDCSFKTLCYAVRPTNISGSLTVVGNDMRRIYSDFIYAGITSDQSPFPVTITDNFCTMPFSASGDPGDPHSDWIQFTLDDIGPSYSSANWESIVIERNIAIDGNARGQMQGIFMSDAPNEISFSGARVVGNAILSKKFGNGLLITNPKDVYVRSNLVARYDPTDTTNNTSTVNITIPAARDYPGTYYAGGTSLIGANITEGLVNNGYSVPEINTSREANTILGLRGATIAYSSVFADHTATRDTLAQIVAAYAPKAAYAGKGPFANSSYINHAARTTDTTMEPTFVQFTDLTGQTASSVITSNWTKAIGGPATRAISVSGGGEYRTADDSSGTNATSWTSSSGTLTRGKYVQMRVTSGTAGNTVTPTLTIGSEAYVWTVASASASSFVTIDNAATAYSRSDVLDNESSLKKLVVAFRMRPDALTANAKFISDSVGSTLQVYMATTTAIRAQFFNSSRVSLRPTLTMTSSMRTHIITMDFSNANASQGCYWATIEDGVIMNNAPGAGGNFDTRTTIGSGTDYGAYSFSIVGAAALTSTVGRIGVFGESDGGGVLLDGAFEFLWIDWGGSGYTIPDVTNSSVRNLWTPGSIGANGQGPTGSSPKLYWTAADLAEANSAGGIPNRGSLSSKALIKQAGMYA